MAAKKHTRCKATLIRTWRATVRQLEDAPVAIVAPVHGVFRIGHRHDRGQGHLPSPPRRGAGRRRGDEETAQSGQAGRGGLGARPGPRYLGSEWSERSVAAATPAVMATAATESGSEQ